MLAKVGRVLFLAIALVPTKISAVVTLCVLKVKCAYFVDALFNFKQNYLKYTHLNTPHYQLKMFE